MKKKVKDWYLCSTAGFLFGALIYGSVLSVLHIRFNRIGGFVDVLVPGIYFIIIYGLWAAVVFFFSWPAVQAAGGLFSTLSKKRRRAEKKTDSRLKSALFLGFFVFNFFFWFFYFNFGLTYDHYPFGELKNITGMLLFVSARTVLIAAAVLLVSWVLTILAFRLLRGRGLSKAAVCLFLVFAAVHILSSFYYSKDRDKEGLSIKTGEKMERLGENSAFKIVFVGLDGMDWRVIDPLMAKGELPHFSRLVREGSSGPLETIKNANSPVIWSSIFTGRPPEEHGIFDFYTIQLKGMDFPGIFPVHRTFFPEFASLLEKISLAERHTVNGSFSRYPPIWEILPVFGIRFGIIQAAYTSYPVFKGGNPDDVFISYGWKFLVDEYKKNKKVFDMLVDRYIKPPGFFDVLESYYNPADMTSGLAPFFLDFLKEQRHKDVLMVYFHAPDTIQHRYWKWYQPERFLFVSGEDLKRYAHKIPDAYKYFDSWLGKVEENLDPDTVLVIVSDHGHAPCILHDYAYSQHRHGPPGILIIKGGPVKKNVKLKSAHILDVFPTMLYLLGLPIPADSGGRLLVEVMDPDMLRRFPPQKTSAYDTFFRDRFSDQKKGFFDKEELERLKSLGYIR